MSVPDGEKGVDFLRRRAFGEQPESPLLLADKVRTDPIGSRARKLAAAAAGREPGFEELMMVKRLCAAVQEWLERRRRVNEEFGFHVERSAAELELLGWTSHAARRKAKARMGGAASSTGGEEGARWRLARIDGHADGTRRLERRRNLPPPGGSGIGFHLPPGAQSHLSRRHGAGPGSDSFHTGPYVD